MAGKEKSGVILVEHEKETFKSQTVWLSGHAYIGCKFSKCTVVVSSPHFMVKVCNFVACTWRFEYDLLEGDITARKRLRQLLDLIDGKGKGKVDIPTVH